MSKPKKNPQSSPAKAKPAGKAEAAVGEPRKVRLSLNRIDPMSALKVGFMISVALAVIGIVAAIVLWFVLDGMNVFFNIDKFVTSIGEGSLSKLLDMLHFSRAISLVVVFSMVEVLVLSVLSWLSAIIYNLIAKMVGGLHVVLSED